jgi:hypothetical protein
MEGMRFIVNSTDINFYPLPKNERRKVIKTEISKDTKRNRQKHTAVPDLN